MKTFKSALNKMIVMSVLLTSTVVLAGNQMTRNVSSDGVSNGGGGDVRCADYTNLVGQIVLALNQVGQAKVSEMSNIINVRQLWNIKTKLRCLPEKGLPRQAWSIPAETLTKLDADVWEKLGRTKKIRLAIHELAVLAEYENDGEYFMSDVMLGLLQKYSPTFKDTSLIVELIDAETSGSFFLKSDLEKQVKREAEGKCERNEVFKLEKLETVKYEEWEDASTLAAGTFKVSYRCIPVD